MTIGMHLCRGNLESLWVGDGGYAPIAEALFTRCDVDAYLLEYDTPRAGDFAPLRYLPAGKRAYLGIISTKNPVLEAPDELMRRLDEAARHAPMERLGICPQCGFASAAMSKFAVLPSKLTTDIQTVFWLYGPSSWRISSINKLNIKQMFAGQTHFWSCTFDQVCNI